MRPAFTLIAACAAVSTVAISTLGAAPAADFGTLGRIRDEGFHRSQVMAIVGHLTDEIGPRLTGSPQMRAAND